VTTLLDGKALAAELRTDLAADVAALLEAGGRRPGLVAVLVGDDPASRVYVGSKTRACAEVGIAGKVLSLPATATAAEVAITLRALNSDDAVDGILVQLPLPAGLPERQLLELVDPAKDVDGFHPENVGRLWSDQPGLTPATPTGIVALLRRHGIHLSGQRAVVVGRSQIVGKPMAALLLREHATVTICHSRTRDLEWICREADILVAAIGRPGMIGPDHVRPGAVVVDVGMNRVVDPVIFERLFADDEERREHFERKGSVLAGDVDFARVAPLAAAITPVPGGVGPLTVAMVVANTLKAARRRQGLEPQ
jgi:methylenetetrahydrofolate dehydrogenase (NADP+) / methenyltetrahydrofolate cyclohydrolase